MDLISTAFIAALNAGIGEPIKDAYNALKGALQRNFGKDSDVVDAVVKLEKKSDSTGRQRTLQEEIETIKAQEDPQLKQLAEVLLKKLKEIPEGQKVIKKYNIKAEKIGVVGDHTRISGGQHF
jgi:hypothetical protein